jgi:Holliday junction resolvase
MVNAKMKGTRAERRCRDWLERDGYVTIRAAGSHGLFDMIAINPSVVRLITIKCGTARLSRAERADIASVPVPPTCSKEYWHVEDYARTPTIEVLP